MPGLKELYHDLRRRKLTRTLLAYGGAGWAILEGIERYGGFLPEGLREMAPVLFLLGIPYCLILGWYHGEKGRQRVGLVETLLLVVTTAASLAVLFWTAPSAPASPDTARPPGASARLGVLPFSALSDSAGSLRQFADGLTRELIRSLAEVEGLEVPPERAVVPYRGGDVSVDSIGRALRADLLVDGSVARASDSVIVTATLFEPSGEGATLWSGRFAHSSDGRWAYALIERVTEDLAGALRSELGLQLRLRRWRAETESEEAWRMLQRARRQWETGWDAFLGGDRRYAASLLQGADSLLTEVSELDREWVEPLVLRGRLAERRALLARFSPPTGPSSRPGEILAEGLAEVDRALERDPENARAWEARGSLGLARLSLAPPDPEESLRIETRAVSDLERAVELDPFLAPALSQLAALQLARAEFEEARDAAAFALRANAFLERPAESHLTLAEATFELGEEERALELAREGARRFGETAFEELELEMLAWGDEIEPDVERAWELVRGIEERPEAAMQPELSAVLETTVAGVLARAGLPDSARAVLGRALDAAPDDPRVLRRRIGVLARLGEADRASALMRDFVTLNPVRPERLLRRRIFEPLRSVDRPAEDAPSDGGGR